MEKVEDSIDNNKEINVNEKIDKNSLKANKDNSKIQKSKSKKEAKEIKKGKNRLIKRNWVRISIIVSIVVILLVIISVGIYFIVESTKKTNYELDDIEMNAKINDVKEDILDNKNTDYMTGIFFYTEDDETANYLLRGNTVYDSGTNGAGILGSRMIEQNEYDDVTWYGIEIPDENELIEELLTKEVETDSLVEYIFDDEFEYLGGANNSSYVETWYISLLDASLASSDSGSGENTTAKSQKSENFSLSVSNNLDDEDNPRDIVKNVDTAEDWSVSSGTTLFFNGTKLEVIIDGWTTPTTDDQDQITEYDSIYQGWLDEIVLKIENE